MVRKDTRFVDLAADRLERQGANEIEHSRVAGVLHSDSVTRLEMSREDAFNSVEGSVEDADDLRCDANLAELAPPDVSERGIHGLAAVEVRRQLERLERGL